MKRTPSIVMEVSAMLVDTIHFLTPSGATSNTCAHNHQSDENTNTLKNTLLIR